VFEVQPEAAPYVLEREWHPSQSIEVNADGCVMLRMRVVVDWGLTAWVLAFGSRARVVGPRRLAQQIYEQLEDTRRLYAPRMPLDVPVRPARRQQSLPFKRRQPRSPKPKPKA
jgi:hypothetical protein